MQDRQDEFISFAVCCSSPLWFSVGSVAYAETPAREFFTFLAPVDTHVQRDIDFLAPVLACFAANGVVSEKDLISMRYEMLSQLPGGVQSAFVSRAIACAKEHAAAAALPAPLVASEGMHQLAKVMRQDDPLVHIDMEKALRRTTLSEVPQMCLADSQTRWPLRWRGCVGK